MSHRIFLWEFLSVDEKNKVSGGSASSYFLQRTKTNQRTSVTSSSSLPWRYSKISVDLLLIDQSRKIIDLF